MTGIWDHCRSVLVVLIMLITFMIIFALYVIKNEWKNLKILAHHCSLSLLVNCCKLFFAIHKNVVQKKRCLTLS